MRIDIEPPLIPRNINIYQQDFNLVGNRLKLRKQDLLTDNDYNIDMREDELLLVTVITPSQFEINPIRLSVARCIWNPEHPMWDHNSNMTTQWYLELIG